MDKCWNYKCDNNSYELMKKINKNVFDKQEKS
jgi:hypothetical protein